MKNVNHNYAFKNYIKRKVKRRNKNSFAGKTENRKCKLKNPGFLDFSIDLEPTPIPAKLMCKLMKPVISNNIKNVKESKNTFSAVKQHRAFKKCEMDRPSNPTLLQKIGDVPAYNKDLKTKSNTYGNSIFLKDNLSPPNTKVLNTFRKKNSSKSCISTKLLNKKNLKLKYISESIASSTINSSKLTKANLPLSPGKLVSPTCSGLPCGQKDDGSYSNEKIESDDKIKLLDNFFTNSPPPSLPPELYRRFSDRSPYFGQCDVPSDSYYNPKIELGSISSSDKCDNLFSFSLTAGQRSADSSKSRSFQEPVESFIANTFLTSDDNSNHSVCKETRENNNSLSRNTLHLANKIENNYLKPFTAMFPNPLMNENEFKASIPNEGSNLANPALNENDRLNISADKNVVDIANSSLEKFPSNTSKDQKNECVNKSIFSNENSVIVVPSLSNQSNSLITSASTSTFVFVNDNDCDSSNEYGGIREPVKSLITNTFLTCNDNSDHSQPRQIIESNNGFQNDKINLLSDNNEADFMITSSEKCASSSNSQNKYHNKVIYPCINSDMVIPLLTNQGNSLNNDISSSALRFATDNDCEFSNQCERLSEPVKYLIANNDFTCNGNSNHSISKQPIENDYLNTSSKNYSNTSKSLNEFQSNSTFSGKGTSNDCLPLPNLTMKTNIECDSDTNENANKPLDDNGSRPICDLPLTSNCLHETQLSPGDRDVMLTSTQYYEPAQKLSFPHLSPLRCVNLDEMKIETEILNGCEIFISSAGLHLNQGVISDIEKNCILNCSAVMQPLANANDSNFSNNDSVLPNIEKNHLSATMVATNADIESFETNIANVVYKEEEVEKLDQNNIEHTEKDIPRPKLLTCGTGKLLKKYKSLRDVMINFKNYYKTDINFQPVVKLEHLSTDELRQYAFLKVRSDLKNNDMIDGDDNEETKNNVTIESDENEATILDEYELNVKLVLKTIEKLFKTKREECLKDKSIKWNFSIYLNHEGSDKESLYFDLNFNDKDNRCLQTKVSTLEVKVERTNKDEMCINATKQTDSRKWWEKELLASSLRPGKSKKKKKNLKKSKLLKKESLVSRLDFINSEESELDNDSLMMKTTTQPLTNSNKSVKKVSKTSLDVKNRSNLNLQNCLYQSESEESEMDLVYDDQGKISLLSSSKKSNLQRKCIASIEMLSDEINEEDFSPSEKASLEKNDKKSTKPKSRVKLKRIISDSDDEINILKSAEEIKNHKPTANNVNLVGSNNKSALLNGKCFSSNNMNISDDDDDDDEDKICVLGGIKKSDLLRKCIASIEILSDEINEEDFSPSEKVSLAKNDNKFKKKRAKIKSRRISDFDDEINVQMFAEEIKDDRPTANKINLVGNNKKSALLNGKCFSCNNMNIYDNDEDKISVLGGIKKPDLLRKCIASIEMLSDEIKEEYFSPSQKVSLAKNYKKSRKQKSRVKLKRIISDSDDEINVLKSAEEMKNHKPIANNVNLVGSNNKSALFNGKCFNSCNMNISDSETKNQQHSAARKAEKKLKKKQKVYHLAT